MYKSFLRLCALFSFILWCVESNRAHHYEPSEWDDDDEWDDYHLAEWR